MSKQRLKANFLKFDRPIYEKLRDYGLRHEDMVLLQTAPERFFERIPKKVPVDFQRECFQFCISLIRR